MVAGLSPLILTYCLSMVFIAAIIRGYSGFGFVAIVVLALSIVLNPTEILPVLMILEVVASIQMFPDGWRNMDRRRSLWLGIGALLGTPLGLYLLAIVPAEAMKVVISVIIMVLSFGLMVGIKLKDINVPKVNIFVGFIFGLVVGSAGVGGLALAAFFLAINVTPREARANMIVLFLLIDIYFVLIAGGHGLVNTETFIRAAIFSIPMIAGVALGARLFKVGNPETFRKIVLWMLVGLSVFGIVRVMIT